ncbi:hypothetical protein AB0K02_01040 [Streptomyces sp. NPDC049597]|uniref:hypothetical protein n=1 Tax=Streptomyces sp. NPDC049597 TaxID=3155276 RepID=UPI00343E17E0
MLRLESIMGHTMKLFAAARPTGAEISIGLERGSRDLPRELSFAVRAHRHVRLHPRLRVCRCRRLWLGRGQDLRVSHVEFERLRAGEHTVRRWDGGYLGWTGLHVATQGADLPSGAGALVTMQFTPNGLEELGPYLELRFEAAIGGVSIGETGRLFQVEDSRLLPV